LFTCLRFPPNCKLGAGAEGLCVSYKEHGRLGNFPAILVLIVIDLLGVGQIQLFGMILLYQLIFWRIFGFLKIPNRAFVWCCI
jgi:hypothetical protein